MSSDLNHIRYQWKEVKQAAWRRCPSNLRQSEVFVHVEWTKIAVDNSKIISSVSGIF